MNDVIGTRHSNAPKLIAFQILRYLPLGLTNGQAIDANHQKIHLLAFRA